MRNQLPTIAQAALLIEAKLMVRRNTSYRQWLCAVQTDGKVCRDRHNSNRTETKDSRNMADHIFRHHRSETADLRSEAEALV